MFNNNNTYNKIVNLYDCYVLKILPQNKIHEYGDTFSVLT